MENKNSVLEKLGIDENQSLEEVIIQLKSKLENKVDEEKMTQIIEATTTYFNEKTAVVETEVEDEVVQPVTEEPQNESKEEQLDQNKETTAQARPTTEKPPFNVFEFYNERDKNGFWQKVYAGCTAALVVVSMLLSKRFALALSMQSSSISPLMREVAESKFLLFILLLLVIAIAGIFYIETKLYKYRSSYLSRILSVIAAGFGAIGFIVSLKPVYLTSSFLGDVMGTMDIEPVSEALKFTKTIQVQVFYTFALWIGIAACAAIYFSLQKNKEFVLAKTVQKAPVNNVVEETPAL